MKRIIVSIAWVLLYETQNLAQFYLTGSDPCRLQWKQIKTPHFTVIFPEDFSPRAQQVAHAFEKNYSRVCHSMPVQLPNIPVVIHSRSSVSNGITSWAPRRIELFPLPYQENMYAQDWFEQLALHEFRHVCQFKRFDYGCTKLGNVFFGQAATIMISSIVPPYFFEGDAVLSETVLSSAGRGRQPWFVMETRAQLIGKNIRYSYRKATLGSFCHHVPDIYQFGYLYVASLRQQYGKEIWEYVPQHAGRYPFLVYPGRWDGSSFLFSAYSHALKKQTGKHRNALYQQTFSYLDSAWRKQDSMISLTPFRLCNKRHGNRYTSYRYPSCYYDQRPEILPDKTMRVKTSPPLYVIAEKSGIGQLTSFVQIDRQGNEEILYVPGMVAEENFSVSWPYMAWVEYLPDLRWEHRNYKAVKIFNLETRKASYLTYRTRYSYPVLSPDARHIVVVDYRDDHSYALTLLEVPSGHITGSYPVPGNFFAMHPCWDPDNQHVYAIAVTSEGKHIVRLNIYSGQWTTIFEAKNMEIYQLHADTNHLYFRSGYSGIENIYALRKRDRHIFMVTSSRFGAFDPHVHEGMLYYSNYTADGYDAACTSIDTSSWIPLENVHYTGIDLWKRAYEEEKETFISSSGTDSLYPVFPYSKTRHLFNIHSWTPFYLPSINIAPEPAKVAPGITLYSQNILGTAVAYAGTAYRNDIQKFMSYAGFTYYGFFPVFNASIGYGGQQTVHEEEGIPYNGELMPAGYIRGIMYVPMNFSRGKYYCGLVPETGIYYANSLKYDREKGLYDKGYTRNIYRLQFYRYLKKTDLDIVPRKGVGADLLYAYSPWENRFYGELWSFSVSGYLPGIFKHQSLKLMAGAEYQTPRQYILSGIQRPARGYDNDTAWLKQTTYYSSLQKITLDYILPLCYPDVSLFDIIYIRRFRTNLFFDHSQGKFRDPDTRTYINRELNSAGIEVTCDFHLFHIQSPIGISYRYAYLLGHQTYTWGIYFNVDLLNF